MSAESLAPHDLKLLQTLTEEGQWLRSALCTLARRGVALRVTSPDRAAAILDSLSTFPFYKGGQFIFDLLELEDFMLDGPEPPIVPTTLDAAALRRIAKALNTVKQSLDGGVAAAAPDAGFEVDATFGSGELPPLEAGFYLYQDVVLGIWDSVSLAGATV